jgi:hypothetical protein
VYRKNPVHFGSKEGFDKIGDLPQKYSIRNIAVVLK